MRAIIFSLRVPPPPTGVGIPRQTNGFLNDLFVAKAIWSSWISGF